MGSSCDGIKGRCVHHHAAMSKMMTAPPSQYAITVDPHGVHAHGAGVARTTRGPNRDRPADSRPPDSAGGDQHLAIPQRVLRRAGNNRVVASAERYTRSGSHSPGEAHSMVFSFDL